MYYIEIQNRIRPTNTQYIVVFLFLCVSGNPIFIYGSEWSSIIMAIAMLAICIAHRTFLFSKDLCLWIGGFLFLMTMQYLILPQVSIPANINFLFKLYLAFLVVGYLQSSMRYTYLRVMYWLALISLLFFSIQIVIGPVGVNFDRYKTLFLYNTIPTGSGLSRNSGMFWEPGAFQGYIMIVPLLYIINIKYLWNNYRKECVVLIITLISTQSTTGYIAFAILLAYILITSDLPFATKYTLLLTVTLFIIGLFSYLSFLGDKISEEYAATMKLKEGELSWSRMGSFYLDYQNIIKHPIIGNGFLMEMRYGSLGKHLEGISNGFTGSINMFGLVAIICYYTCVLKKLFDNTLLQKIVFLLIIIILLNGEYYLSYPLFWSLLFIDYSLQTDEEYEEDSYINYSS